MAVDTGENHGTTTPDINHDNILRKADLDVYSLSPQERQYLKKVLERRELQAHGG